jgi:hypothetical protein
MLNQTKMDEIVANKKRRFLFLMGLVLAFSGSLYLLTLMKQSSFALHSDALSHEDSAIFQIGPEVLVSNNLDGGALRCEPSAAISSDAIVIAWNDSYGGIHGSNIGVACFPSAKFGQMRAFLKLQIICNNLKLDVD